MEKTDAVKPEKESEVARFISGASVPLGVLFFFVCDYLVSSYMLFLISEEYCNSIKKGLLFDQNQLEIEIMNDCKV